MATLLPITNNIVLKYFISNWAYSLVGIYSIIGIILHQFYEIDILIPCLFTSIFGFNCPGCGITHAFIEIVSLNFIEAWQYNPLIYVVLPAGILYILKDFKSFYVQHSKAA
jgi:hypothetical protein